MFSISEEELSTYWSSGILPVQLVTGAVISIMALVLFAALSYQCAATWKWIKDKACREYSDEDSNLSKQAAIRISHSLPDLQTEPLKQEYVQEHKDVVKKVRFSLFLWQGQLAPDDQ